MLEKILLLVAAFVNSLARTTSLVFAGRDYTACYSLSTCIEPKKDPVVNADKHGRKEVLTFRNTRYTYFEWS